MKILMFSLLLALGLNANEVVYGSVSGVSRVIEGTRYSDFAQFLELREGESLQILNVSMASQNNDGAIGNNDMYVGLYTQNDNGPFFGFDDWAGSGEGWTARRDPQSAEANQNQAVVGPCKVNVKAFSYSDTTASRFPNLHWRVSYKLTKPAASNTTTSAPILLPPTPNAAASWFVKLQMSSDLKTWEDVQAGQFLGSDAARFFRIQTSEQ